VAQADYSNINAGTVVNGWQSRKAKPNPRFPASKNPNTIWHKLPKAPYAFETYSDEFFRANNVRIENEQSNVGVGEQQLVKILQDFALISPF